MILKPRINLKNTPYSYLEAELDTAAETDIGAALTEFANYAIVLEEAAASFGFAVTPAERPMAREAVAQGAVPRSPASAQQNYARKPQMAQTLENYVMGVDDEGYTVPCCVLHKTRDGRPRPMRPFDNNYKCTAKKQDGTYCTNGAPLNG